MASKKPTGPKSRWHKRKLEVPKIKNFKTINAWAKELNRWAQIITDEVRIHEATAHGSQTDHIPDPPPPPFDGR
jgi:hypothetical protein